MIDPLKLAMSTLVLASLLTPGKPAEQQFMRGMVVSCPRWGPIWGSQAMAESLSEISNLGVDWVAIHPYGWIARSGEIRFRPAAELDFLARAVELGRDAGVSLFWKPHLGYWGHFEWRGDIAFGDDSKAWNRFFADYETFIVDQAAFAEASDVDLLAVGVELDATTDHEARWRRIIARVRAVFSGRILYAANWDQLEAVPFWDAVDVIGVHAYFPLSGGDLPRRSEIESNWELRLADLERLSRRLGKPVLFAEIGYNVSPAAARTPWEPATQRTPEALALRAQLIEVAIQKAEASPFISGMFWWKWMPGSRRHGNFSMREPEAKEVLARHWRPTSSQSTTAR